MQAPAVGEVSSGGRKHAQMGSTEKCLSRVCSSRTFRDFGGVEPIEKNWKRSETGSAKTCRLWSMPPATPRDRLPGRLGPPKSMRGASAQARSGVEGRERALGGAAAGAGGELDGRGSEKQVLAGCGGPCERRRGVCRVSCEAADVPSKYRDGVRGRTLRSGNI